MSFVINKPKEIPFGVITQHDFIAEPKFDGMRGFIQTTSSGYDLISENNLNKNIQFPEIIPSNLIPEDTLIDGEICIPINNLMADFESLQKRINVQNKQIINHYVNTIPVKYMAFDILRLKGKDLTDKSYKDRREILKPIIQNLQHKNIDLVQVADPTTMMSQVIQAGGEGIVIKNLNGKYSDLWIKQKNWKEKDFKVSGVEERSHNWVLNLIDEDKKDVGKVTYTGYPKTDEMRKKLVGMTAVIKYLGMGNKIRIPILKELRG